MGSVLGGRRRAGVLPWAEVLNVLVDRLGADDLRAQLGGNADDLAQIVPALGTGAPDARLAPDTARFRLYHAVLQLCRLSTSHRAD